MIPGEEEGLVHHCQLDWREGGRVLLSSTGERSTPCRAGTSSLHVVTSDPDAVVERALKVGATIVHPLADQSDYPSRDFMWQTSAETTGLSRRSLGSETRAIHGKMARPAELPAPGHKVRAASLVSVISRRALEGRPDVAGGLLLRSGGRRL
jgi:hypothetical protein